MLLVATLTIGRSSVISVIIPTLNAEASISDCIASLQDGEHLIDEVLVVDGASDDDTVRLAEQQGARIVEASQRGRGFQLRDGADQSASPWLFFLHSDSKLPEGWPSLIEAHCAQSQEVPACFSLRFDDQATKARIVEALAWFRYRILGMPYGDQGLLIPRALYDEIGGYPPQRIMEDVALVRALRPKRIHVLPAAITTSSKKYQRAGHFIRSLSNLFLLGCYFAGASDEWLADRYNR